MIGQRPPHILGRCLLALALAVPLAAASDTRCEAGLVALGQRDFEVEERCGEADFRMDYPLRDPFGHAVAVEQSHWYYNPGPQSFIRKLIFQNGILVAEERLGRGFTHRHRADCSPEDLRPGVSEFELIARCGQPLSTRLLWRGVPMDGAAYSFGFIAPAKELVFEFGSGRFRRAVTLERGVISEVKKLAKPR